MYKSVCTCTLLPTNLILSCVKKALKGTLYMKICFCAPLHFCSIQPDLQRNLAPSYDTECARSLPRWHVARWCGIFPSFTLWNHLHALVWFTRAQYPCHALLPALPVASNSSSFSTHRTAPARRDLANETFGTSNNVFYWALAQRMRWERGSAYLVNRVGLLRYRFRVSGRWMAFINGCKFNLQCFACYGCERDCIFAAFFFSACVDLVLSLKDRR